jgi:hypothetical protein
MGFSEFWVGLDGVGCSDEANQFRKEDQSLF